MLNGSSPAATASGSGASGGSWDTSSRVRAAAGHRVTTPDLYDGATFGTLEEGVAHAEGIGLDEIVARGEGVVADLRADLVGLRADVLGSGGVPVEEALPDRLEELTGSPARRSIATA